MFSTRRSIAVLILVVFTCAMAVDRSKFRTCEQTSFCRRNRRTETHTPKRYQYKIIPQSINFQQNVATSSDKEASGNNNDKDSWLQRRLFGNAQKQDANVHHWMQGPTLSGTMHSTTQQDVLQWTLTILPQGMIRWRIDEATLEKPRRTYDELVLEPQPLDAHSPATSIVWGNETSGAEIISQFVQADSVNNHLAVQFPHGSDTMTVLIQLEPVLLQVFLGSEPIVTIGDDLHFEVRQDKDGISKTDTTTDAATADQDAAKKSDKEIVGYWEDGLAIYADGTREERRQLSEQHAQKQQDDTTGMWEEKFGDHLDTKPYGPTSVGMSIKMHTPHVYGLPEHASTLKLQDTTGPDAYYKDPYRLYNLDVFEYELDETMALYGVIPLVVGQSVKTGTTGVFYFNPSETFVDVHHELDTTTNTRWISESGILDVFILPGPTPPQMYQQYTALTGTTTLPPMFALGYHQCRWNYKDEKDVAQVHDHFESLDFPYDVLWLDIEHTDDKRYFTWDKNAFPTPKEMQENLWAQGRRMVTIVDPHIKRDNNYYVHKEATAKGYYIKTKEGTSDYDGWCWPGSSSYLDFTNADVRAWWAEQFSYKKYAQSTPSLFTWNDMNEPSVFNGPEVSMQKDLLNLRGDEHREWHNLYGMLFHRATMEGLIQRNDGHNIRPFVLSRSFFAGSQRYGAVWTGDNTAEWGHLEIATPMLLSLNLGAYSFVGADVGGFFGDPDAELFTRWNQAGAYQPFYRGHAHHDSKRREPWTYDFDTLVRVRRVAMERYALLPYWYTVFFESYKVGMPVMRTLWMQYPQTEALFSIESQYMIGSDLMVKPITAAGVMDTEIIFPSDHIWYDARTFTAMTNIVQPNGVTTQTVNADIDTIPVYQRGGSIIQRKLRLRRSTATMLDDPYTLFVALDNNGQAAGQLYMDDETTFGHMRNDEFALSTMVVDWKANGGSIKNQVELGSGWISRLENFVRMRMIERIVIMGVTTMPKSIIADDRELEFSSPQQGVVVVRRPELCIMTGWTVTLQ